MAESIVDPPQSVLHVQCISRICCSTVVYEERIFKEKRFFEKIHMEIAPLEADVKSIFYHVSVG